MKLTITGSGSGKPTAGKNLSSILLENPPHLFLLDCGEPVARVLAERNLDVDEIEAVIITHFHPDHSSGIYMLLQLFHIRKRTRKLKLFLPENIELFQKSLSLFYLFPEKLLFALEILPIAQLNNEYPWLSIIDNDHLLNYRKIIAETGSSNEMRSCSIFIEADRKTLYTSDTENLKSLTSALDLAELVILDALHPAPQKVWELLQTKKTVVLTHGLHHELATRLAADNSTGAIIAYDGLEIEI
ncbi:MAG: MBL fold metallo-hydrolase [Candidatus Cloacimonetes bacterium]|nr:MBL fold metallo-hydrolase [Candidatus Cloacimonadota bacterium]